MHETLEKVPWPAQGIELDSCIGDYDWGYLVIYADGRTAFLADETPADSDILARWGVYLGGDSN